MPYVYKMKQEKTFDNVSTASKDNWYFPSEEDFKDREKIVKWREIGRGVYKVHEVQDRCLGEIFLV